MELTDTFTVTGKHRTPTEALALADDIQAAIGALMTGKLKPAKLDVGLLTGAVQALRDHVKPAADALPMEPRKGFVAVPLRLTRAMQEILDEEGWQWADLLMAAEATTEEEDEAIRRFESLDLLAKAEREAAENADPIAAFVAQHARLIDEGNNYAYFELAYTRTTDWMAWITDKPGEQYPDRKVLFHGQGLSPEEACRNALKGAAAGT